MGVWVFGYGPIFILWWLYTGFSIGRMIQIKANKKHAKKLEKSKIPSLLKAYPKQPLYAKVNGKYLKISSEEDVNENDDIVLICIGKKPIYELKKVKKILNGGNDKSAIAKESISDE